MEWVWKHCVCKGACEWARLSAVMLRLLTKIMEIVWLLDTCCCSHGPHISRQELCLVFYETELNTAMTLSIKHPISKPGCLGANVAFMT